MGNSNRNIQYKCTKCGREQPRDALTVKRVSFQTMGIHYKVLKSRNTDWLCDECRDTDPVWVTPKHVTTPGMADTKLNPENATVISASGEALTTAPDDRQMVV